MDTRILDTHHCKRCWDRNYLVSCKCGCDKVKPLRDRKSRITNPIFHQHGWGKGYSKHSDGYIYVYKPGHPTADKNGLILQHRLLMEKKEGRLLTDYEAVHHINGVRTDNRIENLRLLSRGLHTHHHAVRRPRDLKGRFM